MDVAQSRTRNGSFTEHAYVGEAGSRAYKLYVPAAYNGEKCPLVVMLHGCTQSADDFAGATRMNAAADDRGCLVAYPIQSRSANQAKCWNWFLPQDQQRDRGEPAIVVGIIEAIAAEYAVDPQRIYVAGLSAGGAAAAVLGSQYPDVFAAIGVHSGIACGAATDVLSAFAAMSGKTAASAVKARSDRRGDLPTIVFHGDRDRTVHLSNSDGIVASNRSSELLSSIETGQAGDGHAYSRQTFRDEAGGVQLERWTIHGAGHAWSGGNASFPYADPAGPDATAAMMDFFLTHRRGMRNGGGAAAASD
jgi:poly(hydroxyalkanoate) depolymerase family esterase